MADNRYTEVEIEELQLAPPVINPDALATNVVDDNDQQDDTTPLTGGTQGRNGESNEGGQGEQPNNEDEDDEIRDDAIGMEAQSLLNIQNEISRPTSIMGFWRMGGNLIVILYLIPVTVALLTVTIVDWDSPCNRPLKHWVLSQIIIQVLLTLNHAIILYKLPSSVETTPEAVNERLRALAPYYLLKRILNLLWFSWFIVGMVWTFQALNEDTCPSSAPYLFRMCFALVVIQIFLTSLAVLFCCCSCLVLFLRVIANPADLQPTTPRGASDTVIRSLPVKRFRIGAVKKEDASCAICLSDYEEGEAIRYLPCNHHYHRNCVDKWLVTNKACPFCKRNIDEGPPPPSTSSTSSTTIHPTTTTTTTTTTTEETGSPSDSPAPTPTAAILSSDQEENFV